MLRKKALSVSNKEPCLIEKKQRSRRCFFLSYTTHQFPEKVCLKKHCYLIAVCTIRSKRPCRTSVSEHALFVDGFLLPCFQVCNHPLVLGIDEVPVQRRVVEAQLGFLFLGELCGVSVVGV